MNRLDLQKLAITRLKDAKALLDAGQYDGAYYLCGYAVECALKACIAKKTQRHDFPDKHQALEAYTHNLKDLIRTAGLHPDWDECCKADPLFLEQWLDALCWSEQSRYKFTSRREALDIYRAVANRKTGVLRWLRRYW